MTTCASPKESWSQTINTLISDTSYYRKIESVTKTNIIIGQIEIINRFLSNNMSNHEQVVHSFKSERCSPNFLVGVHGVCYAS